MRGDEIRQVFLGYFQERDHRSYPSSSLIPPADTNLLLTTAGMVQFRPFFLGTEKPPHPRATSVQKVFRATDIEEVGDQSHQTFFEMLGNFSFGDYFKRDAIRWAWDLSTNVFGLDPERIWVTVYEEDDETVDLWLAETGIPKERIQRLGKDDNFWDMGVPGPGGPNSELFYDRGPEYGEEGGPAVNDQRYLEFYNLVFIQYETDGSKNIVGDLAAKSVDTGMGLERMATVMQGAASSYETDLILPVLEHASQLTGSDDAILLRTLADHSRAATFLIADGVTPSNEGRGYILRRVIRRAITKARLKGVSDKLMAPMADAVIKRYGETYPELHRNAEGIMTTVGREEERFSQTLDVGLSMLEDAISKAKTTGGARSATPSENRKDVLPGEVAFKLQDTFGFPLEITRDVASDAGLEVDVAEFERLMEEQRSRSREVGETTKVRGEQLRIDVPPTLFLGYDQLEAEGTIVAMVRGVDPIATAKEGEEVDVVFDSTPFYAEGGGQVGDKGFLEAVDAKGEVLDTQSVGSLTLHRVRVTDGELRVGLVMQQHVDTSLRTGAEQAHTATHVLHHTLRNVLGEHVRQMGSLVEPGRLRFDFNHFSGVDPDVLAEVEEIVNSRVEADDDVQPFETSYREAIDKYHAMAFFEEKYGDVVRVVGIGDYSYELCGGTHVPHTGRVGFVKVLGEGSIGSNIRRVEALTGVEAVKWVNRRLSHLERAAGLLHVAPDEVLSGIEKLMAVRKDLEKTVQAQQRSGLGSAADELTAQATETGKGKLVVARRPEPVNILRELALALREKLGPSIVVLGTAGNGTANLVAAVTKSLGVDAKDILRVAAERIGGRAGGKPDLAMGGGSNPDGLDEALNVARTEAETALAG